MHKFLVTVLLLGTIGTYFIYAISQNLQTERNDVSDDMICYQGSAYDQMSEGFDAIRIALLQLNNFDDYLDFTRQTSLAIKRA